MWLISCIYTIIIGTLIVSEIQKEQDLISAYLQCKKKKAAKSEAQKFYSSNAWHKARREVRRLQMEISGLDMVFCEDCGITSRDIDSFGNRVVMSTGHDHARSTHKHLALVIDNLFNQCMPCNLAQGIESRMKTGYNTK